MASVFLSAGEASGDHYGAEVMAGVQARVPEVTFFGLGGPAMAAAGLDRVVRAEDVAVMGDGRRGVGRYSGEAADGGGAD